jgi:signal transduction histidine kinase
MFQQIFNWKTGIALIAVGIATGTIFYSKYLAKKIADDERRRVNVWVESLKTRAELIQAANFTPGEQSALNLTNKIAFENKEIPIIETDEKDQPSGTFLNLDSSKVAADTNLLQKKVKEYKKLHPPLLVEVNKDPLIINKYYYGETALLNEVRYYPIIQLIVIALFILITFLALRSSYRSTQNHLWAGMAKETAHQLGTPVSSLEGWIEMLKENPANEKITTELEKDVKRLQLVSDRFGKIGSIPHLDEKNIVIQIENMVDYIRKRASGKVNFTLNKNGKDEIIVPVSAPLFDWVIENLLKNALDAMDGKGSITVSILDKADKVAIEIADTGKGISTQNIAKVFKPGFTTKKRGWGLGLSLSKRIIEQYHKGELYVKSSEPGKGTTFRIVLKKKLKR